MASKYKAPSVIDPIFGIPEGAEDEFSYIETIGDLAANQRQGSPSVGNTSIAVPTPFGTFYQDGVNPVDSFAVGLSTPQNLFVYDQKIRRATGGVVVVDTTVQFDDVEGAQKYEIRLTKI